ncbi:MAG TPA: creatininase family protein [Aggregatilineales bacterium]|nr:creatininase family protein [Aggregatilineales bacterium]
MTLYKLEEMFPADLERRIEENPVVILPFGTIEWHSYHLPIGLDSLKAKALCKKIAAQADAVLAPLTSWAVGGVPFPHTVRFELDLIETLMARAFEQMSLLGFRAVLGITGHYGLEQTLAIKRAALGVMRTHPVTVWAAGEFEPVIDVGYLGDHAAKWETSILWALRPDLVRMEAAAGKEAPPGIIGEDPRATASQSLGEETVEALCDRWANLARSLPGMPNVQRMQYIEALNAGVRVLERLLAERLSKPRSQVPALTTPAYLDHLAALYRGDFPAAQKHAEVKLVDLSA